MKEFMDVYPGMRVRVAFRPGIVYGLRADPRGPFAFIQYDDGRSEWVHLAFIQSLHVEFA